MSLAANPGCVTFQFFLAFLLEELHWHATFRIGSQLRLDRPRAYLDHS